MMVSFLCLQDGKTYYSVERDGLELFVGTMGECQRFLAIHEEKVRQEHDEDLRVPRARPFLARAYRHSHVAAS